MKVNTLNTDYKIVLKSRMVVCIYKLMIAEIQVFYQLCSSSDSDSTKLIRQCKLKTNIWTCSTLSWDAYQSLQLYLLAYSTRYWYWLCGSCVSLVGTAKVLLSEEWFSSACHQIWIVTAVADFFPPVVPMKKPSLISAVITDRLADIWPCQEGGRQQCSDELSNVFISSFLISSSPTWSDVLNALLSKLYLHDKRAGQKGSFWSTEGVVLHSRNPDETWHGTLRLYIAQFYMVRC